MRSNRLSYRPRMVGETVAPARGPRILGGWERAKSRAGQQGASGTRRLTVLGEGDLEPADQVRDEVVHVRGGQLDQGPEHHHHHADGKGPGEQPPPVEMERVPELAEELLRVVQHPHRTEDVVDDGEPE